MDRISRNISIMLRADKAGQTRHCAASQGSIVQSNRADGVCGDGCCRGVTHVCRQRQPVEELRDLAVSDRELEIQSTVDVLRDMGKSMLRMARDPLGNLLPSIIAPLLAGFIR